MANYLQTRKMTNLSEFLMWSQWRLVLLYTWVTSGRLPSYARLAVHGLRVRVTFDYNFDIYGVQKQLIPL